MSLIKWKPKSRDPFDEFFKWDYPSVGLTLFPELEKASKSGFPAIDVSEEANQINIKADLPGLKREDINVSVDNGILTITGERKSETEEKKKNYHRLERAYGSFQRSVDLGVNINQDQVKAKFKDGVLEVTVPKNEQSRGKTIDIEAT